MSSFPDAGPSIVGVSLSLVSLAITLVATRTFYRVKSQAFGWDAALIIAAVVLSLGHSAVDCICMVLLVMLGPVLIITQLSINGDMEDTGQT